MIKIFGSITIHFRNASIVNIRYRAFDTKLLINFYSTNFLRKVSLYKRKKMILGGFLYTFDYVFSRYIYIEKRYIYKKRSCAALHKYWNHEVFLVYRTAFFFYVAQCSRFQCTAFLASFHNVPDCTTLRLICFNIIVLIFPQHCGTHN